MQGQQWQEDGDNNQDTRRHWRGDLTHGAVHQMQKWQAAFAGIVRQMLHHVLDHHHGSIHQHTDRDGEAAETHQIGGHAELAHQDERDQRRQRQNYRDSNRRTHITEEQAKQHQY